MRKLLPLLLILIFVGAADALRPVYTVIEYPEVTITGINANTRRVSVKIPMGWQALSVGPKTWLIKDNEEATFEDLRVGQRVRVHLIPRGAQAVAIEVLRPK
jgi:hypothetical protein